MELYRRIFSTTIESGPEVKLRAENRNGLVGIHGQNGNQVQVSVVAEVYAESPHDADLEVERIKRAITFADGRLDIRTPELLRPSFLFFGRGPKVDYDITVPTGTSVDVEDRNGRVEVRGVRGPVQVEDRNGRVDVEDVAEGVVVETRNGRINARDCHDDTDLKTTNGPVSAEGIGGRLKARTSNGSLALRDCAKSIEAVTTNGTITYAGEVRGDFVMETTNASVRLSVPADSRFEIDAESRNGSVTSSLPARRGAEAQPGPRPKVRIRTQNGSIRLEELR